MMHQVKTFRSNEEGAVTVDWVVLTAAVCGLAIASFAAIQEGSRSVGDRAGDYLTTTPVESIMSAGG